MSEPDWLDISGVEARKEQADAAFEIASLYSVFATDERARKLLAMWDTQLMHRRTAVGATLQEYAANEALRAFVAGIHDQIKIATTMRGNQTP